MSKGSSARPLSVPHSEFAARFDAIFRKAAAPACDCKPGQCQNPTEKCKDWNKLGEKP